jgi:hypothetical protein
MVKGKKVRAEAIEGGKLIVKALSGEGAEEKEKAAQAT